MKQFMNYKQVSKYDMVCALLVLFGKYPEIVNAILVLGAATLQLTAEKSGISQVAVKRGEKKTSIKKVKFNSRKDLSKYTFKYSRKLRSLGKISNTSELVNLASYSVSIAQRMRFTNFYEYATEILIYLKKYTSQLAGHKVTQAMIVEFETMIQEYHDKITGSDVKHSERMGETRDLEEKFSKMMSKVYLIDDIIDGIRDEYSEFCNAYDAVRVIHHYGLRHKTPEQLADIRAKAEARKIKKALARKERAAKAKAEKIKKLLERNSVPGEALSDKDLNKSSE